MHLLESCRSKFKYEKHKQTLDYILHWQSYEQFTRFRISISSGALRTYSAHFFEIESPFERRCLYCSTSVQIMMVSVQSPHWQTVAFLTTSRLFYVINVLIVLIVLLSTLILSRYATTAIKWSTTMSTAQYVPYQAYKVNIDPK